MSLTVNVGFDEWVASQAQPHVKANYNERRADVLLQKSVISFEPDLPTNEANGQAWIVEEGVGAFEGHDNEIAYWYDGLYFITPVEGLQLWVRAIEQRWEYVGGVWRLFETGGGAGAGPGIADEKDDVLAEIETGEEIDMLFNLVVPADLDIENSGKRRLHMKARGYIENVSGADRTIGFRFYFVENSETGAELDLFNSDPAPTMADGTVLYWELDILAVVQTFTENGPAFLLWAGKMELWEDGDFASAAPFARVVTEGGNLELPWTMGDEGLDPRFILEYNASGDLINLRATVGQLEIVK